MTSRLVIAKALFIKTQNKNTRLCFQPCVFKKLTSRLIKYSSVGRNGYNVPRYKFTAVFKSAVTAACSSPPQQGTSIRTTVTLFNIVVFNNLGKLFGIICIIKLRATHKRYVTFINLS